MNEDDTFKRRGMNKPEEIMKGKGGIEQLN